MPTVEDEVVQWPEGFSEKGDVEDWLNGGHRMEDFEFAVYSPEESENETWPEPQPIPDIIPPVESFVLGLLPTVFQPWIRDIAERIQCPPDFPAIGVMVALSAVVGRQVAMRPKMSDDWHVWRGNGGGAD